MNKNIFFQNFIVCWIYNHNNNYSSIFQVTLHICSKEEEKYILGVILKQWYQSNKSELKKNENPGKPVKWTRI